MLVLSRKKEEAIVIGDVLVKVCNIKGSRVQLGIDAPPGTVIRRAELAPRPAQERRDDDAQS